MDLQDGGDVLGCCLGAFKWGFRAPFAFGISPASGGNPIFTIAALFGSRANIWFEVHLWFQRRRRRQPVARRMAEFRSCRPISLRSSLIVSAVGRSRATSRDGCRYDRRRVAQVLNGHPFAPPLSFGHFPRERGKPGSVAPPFVRWRWQDGRLACEPELAWSPKMGTEATSSA